MDIESRIQSTKDLFIIRDIFNQYFALYLPYLIKDV